eukprot:CAMPEP_0196580084 /NCGR_PEP_ID=MMETSP1081-20130531/26915_1 /TAXON_ID=36882 /ORGANISM="Pyramimonas amylifera, Strain CCMP720" /LENGTH=242 /DNA_ID=CAMNT_0041899867 /DNA_START=74 /DNA_END=802 /DNA_ORIENTATION=+
MQATQMNSGALAARTATLASKSSSFGGRVLPVARSNKATSAFSLKIKAAQEFEFEVEKPFGLSLGKKGGPEGGVMVKFVNPGGNAAAAGMKAGDQIIYHSSFFGDELWPADNVGFTNTAIQACPGAVDFVTIRGKDIGSVNVKRLPKREAPKKFGKKLTAIQKERATHICIDCGFIYYLPVPFEEQAPTYICPQCNAPKSRFSKYDPITGKITGNTGLPAIVSISLGLGLLVAGAFVYIGLN